MKVFLDTNVLLDTLIATRPGYASSLLLMAAAEDGRIQPVITAVSVVNADYILQRMSIPRVERRAFTQMLLKLCEIAPTEAIQLHNAFDLDWPDLEDAVQYSAALAAGPRPCLITNDKKGFKGSRIPVFTPDEFVSEHLW